ncbi:MAG: NifB/NifX family molybdenum-iron cluster-binding protein [Ignavibacteriaceae bacterium]
MLINEDSNSSANRGDNLDGANLHRIAITIKKPDKNPVVSGVFGRCSFFLIYDQELLTERIISNPFSSELGAGIQSARLLIENDVDIVITNQIGSNPLRLLKSVKVKIYRCNERTAGQAIQLFNEGKLSEVEYIQEDDLYNRKRIRCGRNISNKNFMNNKKGKS